MAYEVWVRRGKNPGWWGDNSREVEVKEWLKKEHPNIRYQYGRMNVRDGHVCRQIIFERDEDAVLVKLRWSGA